MSINPGSRLGPYEIIAAIGAGGMGEVFRARDTKLNRDVAIKVLPAAFADDPERLARFTREAQTLASLNHPNIASIYGIEEIAGIASSPSQAGLLAMTKGAGASRALVMELVEGEDLSAHIARGPIPVAEALPIARQIAEALEAAHEQGIVHRDLKPANIKVRPEGTVKVLDFGLAKAMDPTGGPSSNPNVSHSPTLTHHGTSAGMIIGTAAYMSPEQAKGKPVDKRADIWAFGVVLYEMLTGKRAFKGDDVSETLASVLKDTLSLDALPATAPPRIRRLIERCLDRDLKTRLRDIGEARIEIARIEAGAPDSAASVSTATAASIVPKWRRALPWAIAGLLAVVVLCQWAPWRSAPLPTPRKLLVSIGADASLDGFGQTPILSPDGTTLAFSAQQAGQSRLFIRKLDQLQASTLAGTEGAENPFFSTDGQWIAFFAGGKLKKISISGGAAIALCDAPSARGGTWTDDDSIIFTPISGATRLMRLSAGGGTPSDFGQSANTAARQRWPQALPGGKDVLYTEVSQRSAYDSANLLIAPLAGGAPKVVVRGGYHGRYLPSGHLVYMQQGTLFAIPFDLHRLETVGQAMPALEGIDADTTTGLVKLAFSSEGTLAYIPGKAMGVASNPVEWVTRDGRASPLRATKAEWENPRFSPDGRKLALTISDGNQRDIWVYEWARDTLTQLTFDPALDGWPVFSPDGRRIVFASDRGKTGIRNLYRVNADGTGEVTRLTDSPEEQVPSSWHPDGRFLAIQANRASTDWDLMILPVEGEAKGGLLAGKPTVFLSTQAFEFAPVFSPDGRWIAYQSREGSDDDVYVRPFPGPGGKWRISTEGGIYPRWSATTNELLFVSNGKVMFAPYTVADDSFRAEKPRIWSPTGVQRLGSVSPYDLHPDGKRIAAVASRDESEGVTNDKVVFFFNFGEYLKKIAPVKP